ncbi:IclR family transcriptional regulator [Rhodococcus sp. W8901]|uniref:IclR family transcriptional regulator n=1 Tax=Rhodococcus sp. W8901 TaxID=2742603 RepID=UPI00158161BF|nr:IclR family transcriptional regulator [Rhodococcus sp. W8901]QKT09753.1 IclR family transcriptional regulator [Rhodococcus sp. W8901]
MSDDREQAPATSMLDRIELVLEALDDNGYLTLSQTTRLTGIPSSSAHRLLEKMVSMRWLNRDGSRYELGVRLFELGSRAVRNHWFHRTSLPILQDLHRSTGAVVHLAFLDGADSIYWDKLSGTFGAKVPSRIGARYPVHRSAVGKALLMTLPREVFDQPAFAHLEAGVVGGRKALEAELDRALAEGVTYDRGTAVPELGCIGAPISRGIPKPAAISICGPLDRITNDRRMAEAVQRAAAAIERAARQVNAASRTT